MVKIPFISILFTAIFKKLCLFRWSANLLVYLSGYCCSGLRLDKSSTA